MGVISLPVHAPVHLCGSLGEVPTAVTRTQPKEDSVPPAPSLGALPPHAHALTDRPDRVECVSCQLFLYQNRTDKTTKENPNIEESETDFPRRSMTDELS